MVALVNFAIHHKVVQLGILQGGLVIGGDNNAHVVEPHPLAPLVADELLDDLLVNVFCNGVPGVIPLGHDVGNGRHQGRQVFHAGTVGTHRLFPLLMIAYSIQEINGNSNRLIGFFPPPRQIEAYFRR